jgi:hypothetical protein
MLSDRTDDDGQHETRSAKDSVSPSVPLDERKADDMFRFISANVTPQLEEYFRESGYIAAGPLIPDTPTSWRTAFQLTDVGKRNKEKLRPFIEPTDCELFDMA